VEKDDFLGIERDFAKRLRQWLSELDLLPIALLVTPTFVLEQARGIFSILARPNKTWRSRPQIRQVRYDHRKALLAKLMQAIARRGHGLSCKRSA
jgi:hypothetical protein